MKTKSISISLIAMGLSLGLSSAQAQNLITNGDFEAGNSSGWQQIDGTFNAIIGPDPSSNFVYEGSHSGRRVLYSGSKEGFSTNFNSNFYPAVPGQKYRFEAALLSFGPAGSFEVFAQIGFYDANHKLIAAHETPRLPSDSSLLNWTEYSITVVAPEKTAYLRVTGRTNVLNQLTVTSFAGFDNFSVKKVGK